MSNYTKTTDFAVKDGLSVADPLKVIKGSEHDTEYTAIQTAVNSKADTDTPTFIGTVTITTLCVTGTLEAGVADAGTY